MNLHEYGADAKLKRGKGAPLSPADVAPDVIADDTRPEKAELRRATDLRPQNAVGRRARGQGQWREFGQPRVTANSSFASGCGKHTMAEAQNM